MLHDNTKARLADFDDRKEELTAIRHYLHQNPELSHKEEKTARFVADKLKSWGYDVTENVGGYGVVAVLSNGTGKRGIAVRADMDALPIREETGLDHASANDGVMHACGHDGHTTILLGAAEYLARTRRFDGTLTLIFQPAEEAGTTSGAQKMIEDGLLERFPFDMIFGLHNHPGAPEGQLLFREGPLMAAADTIEVLVKGRGGHASRPHLTVDPLVTACHMVVALQMVVSRFTDPTQTAVVTVGTIHAGEAVNVIPETARFAITVRSFDEDVRANLETRIKQMITSVAAAHGAVAEVDYQRGHPVVFNAAEPTALARSVAEELVGEDNVGTCNLIPGSEDFSHYLEFRPGCFVRLGNGVDSAVLHSSKFDFADESLTVGAALWARLAERFLEEDAG
ncbi:M20 aminoacylase family protein [uncultured Martelella sp.]|uniref:M20 aminoacylase family protein n=1 Tax=uncultured Martelella sp. TaxID=392331 RepID=UPI0029C67954|nr:M20 aminoacylase family protein [uncultured Martelella sp.]